MPEKTITHSGTYTAKTNGKFVTEDIVVKVPKGELANTTSGNDITVTSVSITSSDTTGYHKVTSNAFSTNVNASASATTDGFITSTDTAATSTKQIKATVSADILDSTIGTSATDPGTSYTENTKAVVPSGGWLTLDGGYMPPTKISLKTLVPDSSDVPTTGASGYIKQGSAFYDNDGTLIEGSLPQKTTGTATITSGGVVSVDSSYNVVLPSVTTKITPNAEGYVTTKDGISSSNTDVNVGTITQGSFNNVTTGTATETLSTGLKYKLSSGYFPNDTIYEVQGPTSESTTGHISGTHGTTSVLSSTNTGMSDYITLSGYGDMTTGNVYNGTYTTAVGYIEV